MNMEFPVTVRWNNPNRSYDLVVTFLSPKETVVVETSNPEFEVGRCYKGYFIGLHCSDWKPVEVPYDPNQNGDTDEDV